MTDTTDFKVICTCHDQGNKKYWEKCVFVPHSVSEFFAPKVIKRWPFQLRGILTAGFATHERLKTNLIFPRESAKMVGWMKGDILFGSDRKKITEQLRESLGFPYEKTVLITCGTQGYLNYEKHILNTVIPYSNGRFNILLKERGIKYDRFSKDKHIHCIDTIKDITPFYLVSDLLLSSIPVSSTLIEICQVNKPSISVTFGNGNWIKQWEHSYLGEPDVLCKLENLNPNIMTLLEDSEHYSNRIREKLERFIHKPDGHATERGIKALKELIEE